MDSKWNPNVIPEPPRPVVIIKPKVDPSDHPLCCGWPNLATLEPKKKVGRPLGKKDAPVDPLAPKKKRGRPVGWKMPQAQKDHLKSFTKGKSWTPEHKARYKAAIEANKAAGFVVSAETRQKMRLAKLGKKQTAEHKKHLSEAGLGRVFTPEHLANLSESLKKAFKEKRDAIRVPV